MSRSVERTALEAGELVRMQRPLDELERRIDVVERSDDAPPGDALL